MKRKILHTAAVVEGTVASVDAEYSENTGPWTRVRLENLTIHRGALGANEQPKELSFVQRGGNTPTGTYVSVSTNTEFVLGGRYLLFLHNTPWRFAPYHSRTLRIAAVGPREVLLTRENRPVTDVSSRGLSLGPEPLFRTKHRRLTSGERVAEFVPARTTLPANAMLLTEFLTRLDSELSRHALEANGVYQPEPVTRSRYIQLTPHPGYGPPPSMEEQIRAQNAPSAADTEGPPPEEKDN